MTMRNYLLPVGTVAGATTVQFATTSELLDSAYRLAGSSSCERLDVWWVHVWPSIQRIEARLRAGATRGHARDEIELARLVLLFERMQPLA
jgi:hypothetical protein